MNQSECVCGTPALLFIEHNGVPARRCPNCKAVERARAVLRWMSSYDIPEGLKFFSVAPSVAMKSFINSKNPSVFHKCDIRPLNGLDFQADISNMPQIKDEIYDFVITIKVLEHCIDDDSAIREIKRILKDGGKWIINGNILNSAETITLEDPTRYYGKENLEQYSIGTFRRYGIGELKQKLESQFRVEISEVSDEPTGYEGFLILCTKETK